MASDDHQPGKPSINSMQHVFEDFTQRDDFHQKVVVAILLVLD
jgi:hypothetical protein